MLDLILNIKKTKIGIEIINKYLINEIIEKISFQLIDKKILNIYQNYMKYINIFIKFMNIN